MKQRTTPYLLGILILLIAVAYLLFRSPGEREASYSLSDVNLAIDSAQVQSVKITRGVSTFALENIGGTWHVIKSSPSERRYPADEGSIQQLLGSIGKLKVLSLVSSNPDKRSLFQVDTTGTLVSVSDRRGKMTEFVVGKMGPSFSETYLRPAASDNVYLVEGISSWEVNKELRDWRDKTILRSDSIRSITYRYFKSMFSLLFDSTWSIQPPARSSVVPSAVTAVLGSLSHLRADDFVDSTAKISLPQLRLELATPEAVTLSFSPMPPDSSKYWVTSSTSPQIFVMNKWNVQPILKQRKDFLSPEN